MDLLQQLKNLISENTSLKIRLDEQNTFILQREKDVVNLKQQIAHSSEAQSMHDNKLEELEILQHNKEQMQKIFGTVNQHMDFQQSLNKTVNEHQQLQELHQQYNYLNTQFLDLQHQFKESITHNTELQQRLNKL